METLNIILNAIYLLGIIILGLFLKNYIPKYLSEKAKNLATKEDIAEITDQIEGVKSEYSKSLEKIRFEYQVKSALKQAFQAKSLESLEAINDLLVDIHLYCWKNLADRSPNEHYVWSNVDDSDNKKHFHYYRVAIDKVRMEHGLYLSEKATSALKTLADSIGLLSSMELYISPENIEYETDDSIVAGYRSGIKAVEKCRIALISELGIS